jgi:hypothetical protein
VGTTGAGSGRIFKSSDAAGTWTLASTGVTAVSVQALAADPQGITVYSGTVGDGVSKSTDSGRNWASANIGLTSPVRALAVDHTTPSTVYAGTTSRGLFKSTDAGATWAAANSGLSPGTFDDVRAVAIDPTTPATTDSGSTWVATNAGLWNLGVGTLAIDPTTHTDYAGTQGSVWQLTPRTSPSTTGTPGCGSHGPR